MLPPLCGGATCAKHSKWSKQGRAKTAHKPREPEAILRTLTPGLSLTLLQLPQRVFGNEWLAEQKRIPTRPTQCVPVRPAQPTIPNPNKGCRMPSVQLLRMRPSSSSWNGTISQFVGRVIRLMPCLSHYQGLETLSPSMLLTARLVICQLRLPTLALLSAPAVLCLWETIQPPNARAPSQPFFP